MRKARKFPAVCVLCCCCVILFTLPAYGYADPNTVGLLSQMLTPLLLMGAAAFTVSRRRVGEVFSGLARRLRRRNDAPGV